MHSCKKDNNNRNKDKGEYKGKKFNLKLVTYAKAAIIRYKY
jgi:hypothetical protein